MQIILNGEPHSLADGRTAAELIDALDLTGKRLAMEVNEEILLRSEYAAYRLREGDRVEIVHAIGGG
jgi:sulfur carrier protein